MKIGVIGDDFTGSSDAANTLARAGARTLQYAGVPEGAAEPGIDAAVISLKTRSVPAADAVAQSLAACRWLRAQGAAQVAFKYCSTFDSTREGNIGPVAEALIVSARRNVGAEMARLIDGLGFEVVSVTTASARRIAQAYDQWGKGVSPAALNFGDCFAYEVAKEHACRLLHVGDDFSKTDIESVL